MTVIDDDLLDALLKDAGSSFPVPESGPRNILERAFGRVDPSEGDDDPAPSPEGLDELDVARTRRLTRLVRSNRLLTVAACLAAAVLAVVGVAWIWRGAGATTAGSRALNSPLHQSAQSSSGVAAAPNRTGPVTGSASGHGTHALAPLRAMTGTSNRSPTTSSAVPSLPSGEVGQSTKIEQTGSLSLVVAKGALTKTMTDLTFLATSYNGFVASSQTQAGSGGGTPGGSVTLQVPVDSFTIVLKKAQSFGKTAALSTKATNVTAKYVNLQAQVTALQASLQQYLTIMTKATTIGDILSVQTHINTIQSQIQQLQTQEQVLTKETAYSTLTVMVNEKTVPVPVVAQYHQSGLAKAWDGGVHGFVDAFEGLVRVAGPTLFVLLCIGTIIVGARFGWRRYRLRDL